MYPIKFENIYFEKIWGGRYLEKYRNNMPEGNIGESWDIACHENGMGIVQNGYDKGLSFKELIDKYGTDLLGKKVDINSFPLLIKIISAKEKLSVQVHPDDKYAKEHENSLGKTECWYVIDATKDAKLIVGTKNCTHEIFKKALDKGTLDKYLNIINVKKGDMFFIESGLVHAICGGVTIAEIQQNSDITYRVYDYNRGRELHVLKALDVINFSLVGKNIKGITKKYDNFTKTVLCKSEFFNIDKYDIFGQVTEKSDDDRFYLFTCVSGSGRIVSGENILNISACDSILIPAKLGEYYLEGEFSLLKSYVETR